MRQASTSDPWRLPTFLLWLVFMLFGLLPENIFRLLQSSAGVIRYEAMVASPLVLTVAFAGYFAAFVYSEAVRAGCPQHLSLANAIQTGAIALLAFLPITLEALRFAVAMQYANLFFVSVVVLSTAFVKLVAWIYLFSFLFRYYLLGNDAVFAQMASIFPSAHRWNEEENESSAETGSTIPKVDSFETHENARRFSE